MQNTDYVDDLTLIANIPTQAETLLPCLKKAAGGIVLYVNANKAKFLL